MKSLRHALALCAALLLATGLQNAHAVPITIDLDVIVDGSFPDPGFGGATGSAVLEFDDALLTGVGFETLGPLDIILFELTLFGQTFVASDDVDFPDFPLFDFFDGVLVEVDYLVNEVFGDVLTPIVEPGVMGFGGGLVDSIPGALPLLHLFVETYDVPEPATLGLAGFALLAAARRRAS